MARVIEVEVINPYYDVNLKRDMAIGDRMNVSPERLKEIEEAEKKNKIQLVSIVKIVKEEG